MGGNIIFKIENQPFSSRLKMTHSSLAAPTLRLMFCTLGGIHSAEGVPLLLLYVSGIHQLKLFSTLFFRKSIEINMSLLLIFRR
jgi:hypothetical protein